MDLSRHPATVFAVQRILLLAQVEALRLLIEPELEKTMGKGQPAKEYMRIFGEVCERMILNLGDSNPAFSELVSAEVNKLKEELRKRSS